MSPGSKNDTNFLLDIIFLRRLMENISGQAQNKDKHRRVAGTLSYCVSFTPIYDEPSDMGCFHILSCEAEAQSWAEGEKPWFKSSNDLHL